jgi:hypothetical protein
VVIAGLRRQYRIIGKPASSPLLARIRQLPSARSCFPRFQSCDNIV